MAELTGVGRELLERTKALEAALLNGDHAQLTSEADRRDELLRLVRAASPAERKEIAGLLEQVSAVDARINERVQERRDQIRTELEAIAALRDATRSSREAAPPRFVSRRA